MPFYVYRGTTLIGKYAAEDEAKQAAKSGDVIHNRAQVAHPNGGICSNPGVELFPHANED